LGPVGVLGLGNVGGAVARAFSDAGLATRAFDSGLGIGRHEDLSDCEVVFVCVPTPGTESGAHDPSIVWSAIGQAEPHLRRDAVVAVKSTVPPGTCAALARSFPHLDIAHVPEFLVQARPDETFTRPDRVVIGAGSEATAGLLRALMGRVAPTAPILVTDPTEAELIKLCSNAMLSAKIAMANELAEVCGAYGVDWRRVQPGVGLDRRIGPDHLTVSAERGFGGSCLPKDLDGLIAAARSAGYDPTILEEIAASNRRIRHEAAVSADGSGGSVVAARRSNGG
jgi:UDPglucose 6-dehydrogenase